MQQIYVWHSDYLKNYAPGHVIAMAASADEAREKIMAGFETHDRERYEWDWTDIDNNWDDDGDTAARIESRRALLRDDIAGEPRIVETLFVSGSE